MIQLKSQDAFSFLQFLEVNGCSKKDIADYISVVMAKLARHHFSTKAFENEKITSFKRALAKNKKSVPAIIDIDLLTKIVFICDSMSKGEIFKAFYLTAFFSFLRISSLVPHAVSAFSPLEHIKKGDVHFVASDIHLHIKYMTKQKTETVLIIPYLGDSPLNPVRAIETILQLIPGDTNSPLFQIKNGKGKWVTLTVSRVQNNLEKILSRLGLPKLAVSLDTFRRSGATLAFNLYVKCKAIQNHGIWTSDYMLTYVAKDRNVSKGVADALKIKVR